MKNTGTVTQEKLNELQRNFDIEKWLASERVGKDLCGTWDFCVGCDKEPPTPCARSIVRARSAEEKEEVSAEPAEEYVRVIRYRRGFLSRLIQNERAQEFYNRLKNLLAGYAGIKSRRCFNYETFRFRKNLLAKVKVSGKTLCLFLALNPETLAESKVRFQDVSSKKAYARVPVKLKITSARALRRAEQLIARLAELHTVAFAGETTNVYCYPYETDEQLIARGLIKPYAVYVRKS